MTKKEALTNLRQLLQELYSTEDDASRIAEESSLNLAAIATSDKLVNFWWNILVEAHKRGKIKEIIKNATFEWSERAADLKSALDNYQTAQESAAPIEPIGAPTTSQTVINTEGGAYIRGGVKLGSGDFIGRDKVVQGDEVKGDKVMGDKIGGDKVDGDKITVGNMTGNTGVAIGRGAQAIVMQNSSPAELRDRFAPLLQATQSARADKQAEARQKVEELKQEASKGDQADDRRMAKLINGLVALVPSAVSMVVSIFATPILSKLAGNATQYVLDEIQGQ